MNTSTPQDPSASISRAAIPTRRSLLPSLFCACCSLLSVLAAQASNPPSQPSSIDPNALQILTQEAEKSDSNALFLYEKESLVVGRVFQGSDKKIYLYSVTKLFTGLAVGLLWDRGIIKNVEDPVSLYYPELIQDPLKARITIRHLLNHTSGIETTQGSKDIYPQKDFVQFALQSPMVSTPGEKLQYNNRAINIVSGVIQKAAGKNMEKVLDEFLFRPMGIRNYRMGRDQRGHTWAMDGLEMKTSDLARVGSMLSMRGRWQGRQIISERWLDLMSQATPLTLDYVRPWGLSAFAYDLRSPLSIPSANLDQLLLQGAGPSVIQRLREIADQRFDRREALGRAIKERMNVPEMELLTSLSYRHGIPLYTNHHGMKLIAHSGDHGQFVAALTPHALGVARTIERRRSEKSRTEFSNFLSLTSRLIPTNAPALGGTPLE